MARLRIPTVLAVSALGLAPACGGDDTSDSGNDGPGTTASTTASDGTGPVTDGGTATSAMTTTASSGASEGMTGTDTGALPDCQAIMDAASCEATTNCVFIAELGGCIVECMIIEDEMTCTEEQGCLWYGDFCDFEPLA